MQGFILPDITATKKCTLILGSTSRNQGQGHRVKVPA